MRIEFHPEAEDELLEAARYYQKQAHNLGAKFLAEVDAALDLISDAPDRWQLVEEDVRRFVLHRFHHLIFYQVREGSVFVLSIMHHSQHPASWKSRVP